MKIAVPLAVLFSCGLLAFQPELRDAIPLLVGVTAVMMLLLVYSYYYSESKHEQNTWSAPVILTVALGLRLLFLFNPPQLSDDINRYLWDGCNLIKGVNPYAAAPSAVRPPPELAAIHARINHPGYVTIYPPAAQAVFAGGALWGKTITGLKAFLVLLDVMLCVLLVVLLRRIDRPVGRSVLYAWNPLPIVEIAGSGHIDGAGLAMLMASFCLLIPPRKNISGERLQKWPCLLSGALLAGAGLVKLYPFVFAPVLLLLVPSGRRRYFATGLCAASAALIWPFMPHLVNMTASLDTYARNWEFAGFAFNLIRSLSGSGAFARLLLAGCFAAAVAGIVFRLAVRMKQKQTPGEQERYAMQAGYAIAMVLLLLTPTLQPWYALVLAVFLPFCAGPAGLVLCWVVFLTYQVQISYFILGIWSEKLWVTSAVFLAPLSAYLLCRLCRTGVR